MVIGYENFDTGITKVFVEPWAKFPKAKNNAWYVYRYHLFGYFDEYGIPIPEYELNEEKRMVDVKTNALLCPFG